jgi:hypothetical protein
MSHQETELRQCGYHREGPRVGRRVVLWRQRCKRLVRVPAGAVYVRCWQHPSSRLTDKDQ